MALVDRFRTPFMQLETRAERGENVAAELGALLTQIDGLAGTVAAPNRHKEIGDIKGRFRATMAGLQTTDDRMPNRHEDPGYASKLAFKEAAIAGLTRLLAKDPPA